MDKYDLSKTNKQSRDKRLGDKGNKQTSLEVKANAQGKRQRKHRKKTMSRMQDVKIR